jgi:hypothetical protein
VRRAALAIAAAAALGLALGGCAIPDFEAPHTGASASSRLTLASTIDKVIGRADLAAVPGRTVYVAGWADSFGPRARRGKAGAGEAARRAEAAYVANAVAARVVAAHGLASATRAQADLWIIPWIQVAGGETTHRELRYYYYPVYVHEEDYREVSIALLLYEPKTGELTELLSGRTWDVQIDAWALDIFGFRFLFGF